MTEEQPTPLTEERPTPWVQADREAKRRAARVFVPVAVPEVPGVIVLPSRSAYRLDVVGTVRRLVPKVHSKKERRRLRAEMKLAQEAARLQADSAIAREGDSSCSPA